MDLQLLSATADDTLVGTFLPPSPILPPNSILPPSPIRLAYWTGSAWAPVVGNDGTVPSFSFDYATSTASPVTVQFGANSTPRVTALDGTVFAFVAAYGFDGFQSPVDNDVVNVANAGRAIPLKWRVVDLGGNPVTDLEAGAVDVTSVALDCGTLSTGTDNVDAYATGASGLQNLGDGYYQWNWDTSKTWGGTCRRLRLDLGDRNPDGSPIYHTADFRFR